MRWCDVDWDEQERAIKAGAVLEFKEASMEAGKGYIIIWALDDFKKGCWEEVSCCIVW